MNEPFYDSEEEIAWGPLSIREIKNVLKQHPCNNLERRHSIHSIQPKNIKTSVIHMLPEVIESTANLNISSSSNEYLTANESLKTEKNSVSDFLEKLNEVINEPVTKTCTGINDNTVHHGNDTYFYNILTENSHTVHNIESIQQSLVENTVVSDVETSKDFETETGQRDHSYQTCKDDLSYADHKKYEFLHENTIVLSEDSFDTCSHQTDIKNEVNETCHSNLDYSSIITISDEEQSHILDDTSYEDATQNEKHSLVKDDLSISDKMSTLPAEVMYNSLTHSRYGLIDENLSRISDNTEDGSDPGHETDSEQSHLYDSKMNHSYPLELEDMSQNTDITKDTLEHSSNGTDCHVISSKENIKGQFDDSGCSAIIVPEIDTKQFDESHSLSDYGFNDTLEEMERALKEGLNYAMPGDSNTETSISSTSYDKRLETEVLNVPQIHSKTNKETQYKRLSNSERKLKAPSSVIPIRSVYSKSCEKGTVSQKKVEKPNISQKLFKTPLSIPTIKCTNKLTPSKSPTHNILRTNIVSPVSVYIHGTPRPCIRQKIPIKTADPSLVIKSTKIDKPKNKENICSNIPQVVYKPSKLAITKDETHIKLPSNISKLVKVPELIKHESRTKKTNMNETRINQKLSEIDLTTMSIDASMLNSTNQDISIRTNKQVEIKKH